MPAKILEEGSGLRIDFGKLKKFFEEENQNGEGVIPVVVQDAITKEVLIVAYVNEEALDYSLKNRVATFWSTSRNKLWVKGLTSGSTLELKEVRVNCEQNSLLFLVNPVNGCGACHTKENGQYRKSCYYRKIKEINLKFVLETIQNVERSKKMKKKSLGVARETMEERIVELVERTGVKFERNGRNFNPNLTNSDIFSSAFFLRPKVMSGALATKKVAAAIYGKDWYEESGLGNKLSIIVELPYAKKTNQSAHVVVFGKTSIIRDNERVLVASEYPKLAMRIFKKASIHESDGGTEQMVAYLGYDYGVCVMETGESLRDNGLEIVEKIMTSPTVLVAKKITPELKYFGELLVAALRAEKYSLLKLNVDKGKLNKVIQVLPALRAPTVSRLSDGNFAVETVAPKEGISNLVIALKKIGATGILVQSLDVVD